MTSFKCMAVFEQASVSISDVDICGDAIGIELGGTGLSGQLVVTLIAAASSHDIYEHSVSSGTHTIPFGWGGVPVGVEYTSVRATWSTCEPISESENAHFMNLGSYRHSQYATPDEHEQSCVGAQATACFSSGPPDCFKSVDSLNAPFATRARINGHGISLYHGNIPNGVGM